MSTCLEGGIYLMSNVINEINHLDRHSALAAQAARAGRARGRIAPPRRAARFAHAHLPFSSIIGVSMVRLGWDERPPRAAVIRSGCPRVRVRSDRWTAVHGVPACPTLVPTLMPHGAVMPRGMSRAGAYVLVIG